MIQLVSETVWFFLPAMAANMAPVFAAKYGWAESLNVPIDQGVQFRNRRLFGQNKTVRGLVVGVLAGGVTAFFQYFFYRYDFVQEISLVSYSSILFSLFIGFLLGFSALLGDSLKSFFKRQLNIKPGHSWPVFDQVDFVLGVLLTIWWFVPLSFGHVLTALIVIGFSSFAVSLVGVIIHVKNGL